MKLRSGRGRAAWFAVFWAAIGVGSFLFGVQNELGQRAENSVLGAATFSTAPPAPLNLVSTPSVAVALLVIGVIALAAHGIRRAFVVTVVPALAIVASQLLKQRLLTRPDLFEFDMPNTFPSGHMTVFTVLIAGLIWAVPAQARALVTLGGAAVLGAAGWQLLAYGWHRPSDVLGGLALGVLAFSLACLIRPATARGHAILGVTASIGLAMLGWVLIAGAVVLSLAAWVGDSPSLMLSAGQFGCIGTAALASRALLILSSGK